MKINKKQGPACRWNDYAGPGIIGKTSIQAVTRYLPAVWTTRYTAVSIFWSSLIINQDNVKIISNRFKEDKFISNHFKWGKQRPLLKLSEEAAVWTCSSVHLCRSLKCFRRNNNQNICAHRRIIHEIVPCSGHQQNCGCIGCLCHSRSAADNVCASRRRASGGIS